MKTHIAVCATRLAELQQKIDEHRAAMTSALEERNALILAALEAGYPSQQLASWTGISKTRVTHLLRSRPSRRHGDPRPEPTNGRHDARAT